MHLVFPCTLSTEKIMATMFLNQELLIYVISYQMVDGLEPSRAHVYLDTLEDRKTQPAPMDEIQGSGGK